MPVGSYTVQVLNQMGLNSQVQANVVSQETDDANVVAKVALGQVDAGFVYLSDYVINPTAADADQGPGLGAAEDHLRDVRDHEEPEPGRRSGVGRTRSSARPAQAIFVKDGFLPLTAPVPTIAKLAPKTARAGATVTITGTNLKGTTSITFQGVPAKFKVVSPTKITLTVPTKAKTGSLTVTNPSGTATWKSYTIA